MSHTQRIAENIKLARQLSTPPAELTFLKALDHSQLRQLREDLSAAMFDESKPHFERVAATTKLLPNKLIAGIAEKVVGPMLCARIVGLVKPSDALDITLRTSDEFLADASTEVDPRSATELISRMPVDRIAKVTAIMVARKEYVTMARFVDHVAPEAIGEVMLGIDDDEALLRTAFFIESKSVINGLLKYVPPERIKRMAVLAGNGGHDLWAEALALMAHMDDEWKGRIGDIVAEEGTELLTSMLESAKRLELWDSLMPVVACMSEESRQKLVKIPALADPAVLQAIVTAANESGLWESLLPLAAHMEPALRKTVAAIVEQLSPELLLNIINTANQSELWPSLIGILDEMQIDEQRNVVALVIEQPEAVLSSMLQAVDKAGLWANVLPLLGCLDNELRTSAAKIVERLSTETLLNIIDVANDNGLWAELIAVLNVMSDSEKQQLLELLTEQPDEVVTSLIDAAHKANLWDELKPSFEKLEPTSRAKAEAIIHKLGLSEIFSS